MKNRFHFPTKAQFHAFLTNPGLSRPGARAYAMHATQGTAAPASTDARAAAPAPVPAAKPTRAELAAAAQARTKAREEALYAKVSAAIGTKRPR